MMAEMSRAECLYALGTHDVGRLCIVDGGYPSAFPVNYRVVVEVADAAHGRSEDQFVVVFRARDGGILDHPGERVGFQVDGTDPIAQTGWSVLVLGTLHGGHGVSIPPWLHSWDPHPWLSDRETWLYISVDAISGRQLLKGSQEWAFEIRGYL